MPDNKVFAKRMSRLRASTVEPVLGTLINTRGIDLANKHVLMAALTYNLKKYMKFIRREVITDAKALRIEMESAFSFCFSVFLFISHPFLPISWGNEIVCKKRPSF